MSANDHIVIGVREQWGHRTQFGLSQEDRRQHTYVIGKTGVGKTTLLQNMIVQDIEAGRGVAVIDPHGEMAEYILDHIPRHRTGDVVYFDPADLEFPVGFNLVENVPENRRHLVASGVVGAFKSIWGDSWGPRLEYILYAAVAAVLDCENVSILGVQRILYDPLYRAWVVKQVKDPVVREFWEYEFAGYDKRFLREAVAPIQNKIGQLLMSPHLRNVLGQVKGRFDARFVMDNQRIFIANLSKGRLGADKSGLLGALLVAQFHLAAMSRADVPASQRSDFHLYVDEFQSFVTDSFASILSEARKYRLCLVVSHQYTAQVRLEILDAVLGNVGSILSFRVGPQDADVMARAFGGVYPPAAFTTLDNRMCYAKLVSRGRDAEPFLGETLPPPAKPHGRRETILRRSRERYARKRAVVEDKIERWMRRCESI